MLKFICYIIYGILYRIMNLYCIVSIFMRVIQIEPFVTRYSTQNKSRGKTFEGNKLLKKKTIRSLSVFYHIINKSS